MLSTRSVDTRNAGRTVPFFASHPAALRTSQSLVVAWGTNRLEVESVPAAVRERAVTSVEALGVSSRSPQGFAPASHAPSATTQAGESPSVTWLPRAA